MRHDIHATKAALGWRQLPRPILALHISQDEPGDKLPMSLDEYARMALAAREAHGFRSVLLLADTPQVLGSSRRGG